MLLNIMAFASGGLMIAAAVVIGAGVLFYLALNTPDQPT